MLKINLATRPFYNERVVHVVLILLGTGALVLMGLAGRTVLELSKVHTEITRAAEASDALVETVSQETLSLNENVSDEELEVLRRSAAEANRLIDQRVFSWTELFNLIERTLPNRVMLTGLRPSGNASRISLVIGVVGERVADIEEFIEQLEASGSFENVLARQEQRTEDGMYSAQLTGEFRGRPSDRFRAQDTSNR
jgi:Tfp pilus assembly protein PilN